MSQPTTTAIYDHAGSLARMGDDIELFGEMANYLASDGQQWLVEIQGALEEDDIAVVAHRAHALKGLSSNFGECRAWRAAARVETLARQGRRDELGSSVVVLESTLNELLGALSPYLSEQSDE